MRKKNINFTSRLAVAKKISIKALDFEKLPRKFSGSNYLGNAFLNITRSSSNRGPKDNLTSSLTKNKGKILFAKPLTSRSRNENAIKLNVIPKTTATIINITQGQKMHNSHQINNNNKPQKPLNKLFTHSLYVSYNNSSSTYKTFNSNAPPNFGGGNQKSINMSNKVDSKSSSRNQSKNSNNNIINNSTFSSQFINSKDSANNTNSTIEKIKKISNNMGNSKISNKNSLNENISMTKSTLSSRNNANVQNNNFSNNNNNLNINSYNTKGYKNAFKHFSNGNLSSLSHKKLGIKVKKKAMKSSIGEDNKVLNNDGVNNLNEKENDINMKKKINKLFEIPLFQNFNKLRTIVLWRNYIQQNSFGYKYLTICEFVDEKLLQNYYQNGLIKRYNNIKKEELIWNNYPTPIDFLDINEKNKDELLLNLYEKALNTFKNLVFSNNKILTSISVYIFELMVNKLYQNLKKVRFIMKYYYDKEKKAIIKKPSVTVIKEILNKLSKIIERPNLKNKIAQEFIIHNTKIIGNLNLNKSQVKPIITQYLELYKGNKSISPESLKDNFIYGNIVNDFTALQKNDGGWGTAQIIKEIKKTENLIIFSYIDDENLEIILYKSQPIKYNLNIIEQKINAIKNNNINEEENIKEKEKNNNKIKELNNTCIKLKERLELISNVIENKFGKYSINEKTPNLTDIKFIISYIEFLLIKQNIVYSPENESKGIDILMEQNDSQRNKKIFEAYNKYKENNKGLINFDYIHFLIVFDKLKTLIKNKSNDLKYYNNIISFREEFYNLYYKLNNEKAKLQTSEINNINSSFNEINKYKNFIDNMKEEILELINSKNIDNTDKKIDYELFYKDVISKFIKYDKDKENTNNTNNNDNFNYKKETEILEKILFRHISSIKNKEENNLYNLNSILPSAESQQKALKDFPKISKALEEYYYSNNNEQNSNNKRDIKILSKIYEELKSKNYFNKSSPQTQESIMPYPKLYFLSEQKLEKIKLSNKISISDISKYFSKINNLQELEISSHHNKNNIIGIKIFNATKKDYEFFKFLTPIQIPNPYSKNKNTISYFGNLYRTIDKEIENSLTGQLLQSLGSFSKKNFHTWVNTTFSQIAICTLCLIFTNEISNLLADETSKEKIPLKEYNLINQKYNQWLTEECSSITEYINRSNIILTIISHMNIINSLIKNNVYDINSFNWLKYIRHLWDKSKKDVIIECGGWGNYQMKKLNSYKPRILLSPDTDKVFLFNSSCFREKSASIIKVINNKYNNVSYKEIFEEYCSLFWTNMISVDAVSTKFYDLKKIFDVCTIDRSWIFIDNIDIYNTNSKDNINNLIFFSKFIQTIQQEVILNDIKFNDGEKMFCIMGCLNVDNEIKTKCEDLKGSSRILNFIKPDIEFYIKASYKLYNNKDMNENGYKKNIDALMKYEQIIRNKLNGFYFDYDFYNEYINYLVNNLGKNTDKEKEKDDIIENNYENIFNTFLTYYSDKFLLTPNNSKNNNINENLFINYFNENNILYNKEILELYKYLYFYSNEKLIKRNIILKGYGRHFIISNFKKFYLEQTSKNFDENQNLEVVIDEGGDTPNPGNCQKNEKNDDIKKIFDIPYPKNKKLLKIFLDNFNQKLKKLNCTQTDEFKLTLLEYIHKIIKANANNVIYYKLVCDFNSWLIEFINYIESKKKNITNIQIFNLVTQSLILSLSHEKGLLKSIIEISSDVISPQISKQLIQIINKNSLFYYDINNMNYKSFNNYLDYINALKNYLQIILSKNKSLYFIISEHFGNKSNKELSNLYYNNDSYIITDDIKSVYFNNKIRTENKLKIFMGYNDSFEEKKYDNIFSIEKIKDFMEKIENNLLQNKLLYLLSFYDIGNLSIHEIVFLYNSINKNSKENYDIKFIQNPLNMIKTIYKAFPKANYYINLGNNNLLIYIFKNQLFKDCTTIINSEENKSILSSNNIYLDLSKNEIRIKLIFDYIKDLIENNKMTLSLLYKLNSDDNIFKNINTNLMNYIEEKELVIISNMLNDIYSIQSEGIFREKYPNNIKYYEYFTKIFTFFDIKNIQEGENINDNYYNSRLLIQYLKYKKIKKDSLKYKTLASLGTIFNNKTSKINEISILINNTLTNYKELISNKDEYINSKYYYFNSMKISYILNENLYNSTLEKIYLSVSNHFLFSLLLTFEIMVNNFEISVLEKKYALDYIKSFYVFPSDNVIKFKYENETDSFKSSFINDNGKKLIEFYTKKTKSIDNNYLSILNNSLNSHNNKYFYTTSIKKIPRDIDKLLYYITFIPDQSSSIFKYLINKYLLKILNLSRFNINVALRKVTTKQNIQPITVKAFPSINITNFLCSLSAYFEINFYIIRDGNLFKNERKGNLSYGYKYLIDSDLIHLIREGIKNGYWILVCEKIDIIKFMKIMWELNDLNGAQTPHENFKLFFDEKLILNNCKKAIEDLTMIINIDNENVDDLEAAHDIWVNVLEEKLLTESIMNQTQKDVLDIMDNATSGDKTNVLDFTINNTPDNKTNVISGTNNSIVSIKSIYNNTTTFGAGSNNNKLHDLSGLSSWTFLNNV